MGEGTVFQKMHWIRMVSEEAMNVLNERKVKLYSCRTWGEEMP